MEYNVDGVVRYLYRLIDYLNAHQVVSLFVTGKLPAKDKIVAPMVRIPSFTLPLYRKYRYAVPDYRLKKIITEFQPDIMHFHSPFSLAWAALHYGHNLGIPTVATYHTDFVGYMKYYNLGWFEGLGWKYVKAVYKKCDLVFVPSLYTQRELRSKGLYQAVFLPHGVEAGLFNPRWRSGAWRKKTGHGQKILLFVGRLIWEKNIKILADINNLLRKQRQDFVFVIAGDGPKKKELQELMPEAIFLGHLAGQDLYKCYASSDIFVFPSLTETFGFVTIEAMASGAVPVCASRGGASSIIKNGRTGFLVSGSDARLYVKKINQLLDNADLLAKMRQRGLVFARRQHWNGIFNKLMNYYKTVVRQYKVKHRQ